MLISALELHQLILAEAVVLFDCRFSLQNPDMGRLQYLEGHIPGAYYLDLNKDMSSPVKKHGGRHPLPAPEDFADKMSAAGVNRDSRIVVYDNGEGMATRAWWLLRYFGHENVAVLDGGWKAWLSSGQPVSQDLPEHQEGNFSVQPHPEWVVSANDVEQMADSPGHSALVDARSADRYRGENETIDAVAGHIPGAKNAPWTEGLDEHGYWKPADEQRKRFSWADRSPVILYCGSGVTACANWFAMELAGLTNMKLYAGSWSDWCSYPQHRAATGEQE